MRNADIWDLLTYRTYTYKPQVRHQDNGSTETGSETRYPTVNINYIRNYIRNIELFYHDRN